MMSYFEQPFPVPVIAVALAAIFLLSKSPRFRFPVIVLSLIVSVRYILWRGLFTLNPADYFALGISASLLAAELYGFFQNILFYYQAANPTERVSPPLIGERPPVDIFITVVNEPKEILLRTVVGCKAQDYPEEKLKVHVLDDGRREEVRELCASLGVDYIARATNEDAKAGNLNHALGLTAGEFVAVFDCDHIPVRSFLKETIGFFNDPGVAIVQVPHHFYNPDTFQRNLRLEREICNEQDLFFHIIQPGRDYRNSAFFAGSCGVFRRSALAEIGGIVTRTITEDLHTSMVLHARGYRSVYLNRDLSAGLAPESSASYIRQRQRWAKGGVQVFMLDNPLLKKGLTPAQRLNYLASVLYFFHGMPRIVYLAAPLSYLLFGYPMLVTDAGTLLNFFVPHYAASVIAFNAVSKGYRNPFWSDVYETLMSFVLTLAALRTVLRPSGHSFAVTPKGERHEGFRLDTSVVAPHIVLLGLLVLGCLFGARELIGGAANSAALAVSLSWGGYNMLILSAAVMAALERPQKRGRIRLKRQVRCIIFSGGNAIPCRTNDLSETGLSVVLNGPVAFTDDTVGVDLVSEYGEVTRLKGTVVRNDREALGRFSIGINFIDMDDGLRHGVIRQMFSPENCWTGHHGEQASYSTLSFFSHLFTSFTSIFQSSSSLRRVSPRARLSVVCDLVLAGGSVVRGVIRDVGPRGLSMEVFPAEEVPGEVVVRMEPKSAPAISVKGEVAWQEVKSGKKVLGIRFTDSREGRAFWEAARLF
ncbi:MAG TPA: glycosyltransferase [Thermodesulfobacteriota bacterium]|nr:glycosyltransferase [Thermodesulfobacteriota bacterium]